MQKITLTSSTRGCNNPDVFLGYEGENNANKLIFEFTDGFIDGLGVISVKRGNDNGTIDLKKVGETYELEVKSSLVSVVGNIDMQVVITMPNGTIIKYDKFTMVVKDAIDTDSEIPEEYPSWQEIIATELAKTEAAISNAEEATKKANETSEQLLEDKENGIFDGKDGISPSAKVESTSSGAIITVTDSVGTTTATITNGRDGTDGTNGTNGTNGKDGVSPTIKTEQVEGGAKITITDVDGTNAVTLSNGKNGTNGKDGISPIATVTQIANGATVSITDINGTTTATIYNGKDGISEETDPIYTADKPNIALKSELPTKVSELENDSKFISSYTETDPVYSSEKSTLALKSELPTKLSQLQNDSEFITKTVNNLTNYYAKTETYTKTEVNNLIGGLGSLDLEIVQSLPTVGKENTFYLLAQNREAPDIYDEYLYINGWEKIGNTKVDLTNYYTKAEVDNLIPTVPTKVSELENDSGYLKEYTETDPTVPTHVKGITQENITNWNNKSEFSGSYNDLTDKPTIPSIDGLVTTEQLTQGLSTKQDTLTAGNNITIENGVISATGGSGGITELPIASSTTLGGIKVGEGLEITEDGILSALGGGSSYYETELDSCFCKLIKSHTPTVGEVVPFARVSGNMVVNNGRITIKPGERVQINVSLSFYNSTGTDSNIHFYIKDFTNNVQIQKVVPSYNSATYEYSEVQFAQYTNETDADCEIGLYVENIYTSGKLDEQYCTLSVFEIGKAISSGSSYKETELLSEPKEYTQGGTSGTTIGQDLTLLDSIENYDDIVFNFAVSSGNTNQHPTEYTMKVSNIIYNSTTTNNWDGSRFSLVVSIVDRFMGAWFKNSNTLYIHNTFANSSVPADAYFRINSIKGIKY